MIPDADPLHKVTIIPRGRALGVTMQLPEEDKYNYTKEYVESSITILMAGRAAEEMFLESCTTGASNDLERATDQARRMVCEWGMSEDVGPLTFGKQDEQIFLGREIAQRQDYSEKTAMTIDAEVKKIVLSSYQQAKDILQEHGEALTRLAEALLEHETLALDDVNAIIQGKSINKDIKPDSPDAPAADEKGTDDESSPVPSLVNPKERPAPA